MRAKPKPTHPRGTDTPSDRQHFGTIDFKLLERLVDGPSNCVITNNGRRMAGTLYRDTRFGLTVELLGPWHSDQRTGPKEFEEPVINGQTDDGTLFSIHEALVNSNLHKTTIYGRLGFIGTAEHNQKGTPPWAPKKPTFDNVSLWIDWLPEFLTARGRPLILLDKPGVVDEPPSRKIGKVVVTPRVRATQNRFGVEVVETRLDLQAAQRHSPDWWLQKWLFPIQRLVAISLGVPATITFTATRTNIKAVNRGEHNDWLHITGCGWPTMETKVLKPLSPNFDEARLPEPLLDWYSVNLAKTLPAIRNADIQLDFTLTSRLHILYTELSPRHYFLNLVQAAESLHSREHGKEKPADFDVDKFLTNLSKQGVNQKSRRKIKSALTHPALLDFSLADRLASLRDIPNLPPPPDLDPDWLGPEEQEKLVSWEEQIAKARNDISHGSSTPSDIWLRKQAKYLELIVEVHILIALNVPKRQAVSSAINRHRWS